MKDRRVLVLGAIFLVLLSLPSLGQEKTKPGSSLRSLSEILNPDGTLKLEPGVQGSFDPKGFRMVAGTDGKPTFIPAGSVGQGDGSITTASAGDENWDTQFGNFFTNSDVYTLATFGDSEVYIGGAFTNVGGSALSRIAKWDTRTRAWSSLGNLNGDVYALAASETELYVGGNFTDAGGIPQADHIAKWNGSTWSALASGLNSDVTMIVVNGADVYAGGWFDHSGDGSQILNHIAKWNGSSWSSLGAGTANGVNNTVYGIGVVGSDVYVGGTFTQAGGVARNYIAKWNGSSWSGVGGMNGDVYWIAVSAGYVCAGGAFTQAGSTSANHIAIWDGSTWSPLGSGINNGVNGNVFEIAVSETDVYVGGAFTQAGGISASNVARWNAGTNSWSRLGSGVNGNVWAIGVRGTSVYLGGQFTQAGDHTAPYIARWDGTSWPATGCGLNGDVHAIALIGWKGLAFIGGDFVDAGGISEADHIACWNGTSWSAIGNGLNGPVYALHVAAGELDLYAAGDFTASGDGGQTLKYIARFDMLDDTWHTLGSGLNGLVRAIDYESRPPDTVYVAGNFTATGDGSKSIHYVGYWDWENGWSELGGGLNAQAMTIHLGPGLYVGGTFTATFDGSQSLNHIAELNGGTWQPMGSGLNGGVYALEWVDADIYAGGDFNASGDGSLALSHVARWSPASETWSSLGTGLNGGVYAIHYTGKEVYAGGSFMSAGSTEIHNVAKWDGSSWSALGSGVNNTVYVIDSTGGTVLRGDLLVGGLFTLAGNQPSRSFASYMNPLKVISPNGGEEWEAGSTHTVSWRTIGDIPLVCVQHGDELSIPGFWAYAYIGPNNGSFPWLVPAILGHNYIRVSDWTDTGPWPTDDISDWSFTILGFSIKSIGSGEHLIAGSQKTITWETVGNYPTVKIELSTDDGATWTPVYPDWANTGTYLWTVPASYSSTCHIRISDPADGIPYDISNVFSIDPVVVPTITVTSPNGGETWHIGSPYNITWIQTGLTGTVTIGLNGENGFDKVLGTAEATAGTFLWTITPDVPAGHNYNISIWQGAIEDTSDDEFTIVSDSPSKKADFNGDGQEDILWRYYGPGGNNRAWFLGNSGAGLALAAKDARMVTGRKGSKPAVTDPREIGVIAESRALPKEVQEVVGLSSGRAALIDDPRHAGGGRFEAARTRVADPRQVKLALGAPEALGEVGAAPIYLGGGDVMAVGDLDWHIVGTGDFNNDTHIDILWRNISTGTNVVWLMNGTEWSSSIEIVPVSDLSWEIVGTGDFNKDGRIDILWRNSSSGSNVIWYMNGTDWSASAEVLGVGDQSWKIVGTGDFDKDGRIDILWRNSVLGSNVVWYMNDAAWTGSVELISVGDPAWQIMGTGDYDNDGNVDILWRYNGAGGTNVIWYMNEVTWSSSAEILPVPDLNWRIVSR